MRKKEISKLFNKRKYKFVEIYGYVHAEMAKKGLTSKTAVQIQTKVESFKSSLLSLQKRK